MKNQYLVKDLYEAAFLYSKDKKLLSLSQESNFFWFVFEDKSGCEELANSFWAGDSVGNIKKFADSLKLLKERLFARK